MHAYQCTGTTWIDVCAYEGLVQDFRLTIFSIAWYNCTGYKDWIEQAMANSDDPEATLRRIKKFQRVNSFKGTAIMLIAGGLGVWYNYAHPYVPPGH